MVEFPGLGVRTDPFSAARSPFRVTEDAADRALAEQQTRNIVIQPLVLRIIAAVFRHSFYES